MKKLLLITGLLFAFTTTQAQEKKQYRSAESGQYVSKSTAEKSPSTTYSTTKSSSSTKSRSDAPKTTTSSTSSRKSKS
ncbi:hypothetical protein ABGT15_12085 [Flavobacterium enshiense]|uniref:hypothetical protein n=1 Tax=Flavobacterium enshiense TaxID=1341165 RepID=UPI00345C81D9